MLHLKTENRRKLSDLLHKIKELKKTSFGLFFLLFLVVTSFIGLYLISMNQDIRQQASGENYPGSDTATPERPTTQGGCSGSGMWVTGKCYLNWEVLPGGTHMVVPGEFNSYGYNALLPIAEANEIKVKLNLPGSESADVTVSPAVISENPSNIERPKTKDACSGSGMWMTDTCYLNWEVLPGGTHMVVPGEFNKYGYDALVPVAEANKLMALAFPDSAIPVSNVTPEPSPVTISISNNNSGGTCIAPFRLSGDKCVPDQTDPAWGSQWPEYHGCGAMVALYIVQQENPTIDPKKFLQTYYSEYYFENGEYYNQNTNVPKNEEVLNQFGYTLEPTHNNLIWRGEELLENGEVLFVGTNFGANGGVAHYIAITDITPIKFNPDGSPSQTKVDVVDSYFGINECVSKGNNSQGYDCVGKDNVIYSFDLGNQKNDIYVVVPPLEEAQI